jgi:hypothetical protein
VRALLQSAAAFAKGRFTSCDEKPVPSFVKRKKKNLLLLSIDASTRPRLSLSRLFFHTAGLASLKVKKKKKKFERDKKKKTALPLSSLVPSFKRDARTQSKKERPEREREDADLAHSSSLTESNKSPLESSSSPARFFNHHHHRRSRRFARQEEKKKKKKEKKTEINLFFPNIIIRRRRRREPTARSLYTASRRDIKEEQQQRDRERERERENAPFCYFLNFSLKGD